MRRPWCPATRVLEHREALHAQAAAERRRSTGMQQALRGPGRRQPRTDFPPLQARLRALVTLILLSSLKAACIPQQVLLCDGTFLLAFCM
jgi:hypothetical protein